MKVIILFLLFEAAFGAPGNGKSIEERIEMCDDENCDPNYNEPEHTCGSPSYVHDYSCDDENNNSGCNWDGGDCCGDQNKDSSWCTECACLDPNYQGHKR